MHLSQLNRLVFYLIIHEFRLLLVNKLYSILMRINLLSLKITKSVKLGRFKMGKKTNNNNDQRETALHIKLSKTQKSGGI